MSKHPLYDKASALADIVCTEAKKLYAHFGPGLLESIYQRCLAHALMKRGIPVTQEVPVQIEYEGFTFPEILRMDLLVDDCLVVETKAVAVHPEDTHTPKLHCSQCLSYMTAANKPLGLVANFGTKPIYLKRVILRGANGWEPNTVAT